MVILAERQSDHNLNPGGQQDTPHRYGSSGGSISPLRVKGVGWVLGEGWTLHPLGWWSLWRPTGRSSFDPCRPSLYPLQTIPCQKRGLTYLEGSKVGQGSGVTGWGDQEGFQQAWGTNTGSVGGHWGHRQTAAHWAQLLNAGSLSYIRTPGRARN